MNILAIDIGTTTGWASVDSNGVLRGGSEKFAPKANEGQGQRWLKFRQFLLDRRAELGEVHALYYERVMHHTAVQAAHVYGGFEAMLQIWCETNNVPCVLLSPGTIKKHWTGKGNADKKAMIAEAIKRGINPVDDNHADALAILSFAREAERVEA